MDPEQAELLTNQSSWFYFQLADRGRGTHREGAVPRGLDVLQQPAGQSGSGLGLAVLPSSLVQAG